VLKLKQSPFLLQSRFNRENLRQAFGRRKESMNAMPSLLHAPEFPTDPQLPYNTPWLRTARPSGSPRLLPIDVLDAPVAPSTFDPKRLQKQLRNTRVLVLFNFILLLFPLVYICVVLFGGILAIVGPSVDLAGVITTSTEGTLRMGGSAQSQGAWIEVCLFVCEISYYHKNAS